LGYGNYSISAEGVGIWDLFHIRCRVYEINPTSEPYWRVWNKSHIPAPPADMEQAFAAISLRFLCDFCCDSNCDSSCRVGWIFCKQLAWPLATGMATIAHTIIWSRRSPNHSKYKQKAMHAHSELSGEPNELSAAPGPLPGVTMSPTFTI
jgi:hypothetical protein